VPVLVNDRPDIALAAGAAGVHLGPDDLPVALARAIAPPGFVIGASVGSDAEAAAAVEADYWGIGPWRVTTTKADAGTGLGADGFARLTRLAQLAGGKPCLAIGAVRPDDVPLVHRAGGAGVAVVSGILGNSNIREAAIPEAAIPEAAIPEVPITEAAIREAASRYAEAWARV
jgi:thiamine-phosphate pyrophosphorylase